MHTVILCIGNKDGGDDGIGPYIASHYAPTKSQYIIDGGTTPENYTSIIRQQHPKQVIIIDAIDMQVHPGEIRIVPDHLIGVMHISTHSTPVSVLTKYLKTITQNVILIGIQPKRLNGPLTPEIQKSGDLLITLLKKMKISAIKQLHDH
jgi:hydrogenase 3 maturation protease